MKTLLKLVVIGLGLLAQNLTFIFSYQKRYAPSAQVREVDSLIAWIGQPTWVSFLHRWHFGVL